MPLVHTHTFLALGLFSGGYILARLISDENRKQTLKTAGIYLALVLLLAMPQLLGNAIRQTVEGGALRIQFNWVNNSGNMGLIDGYFWFWIKNAGLPYILILCAILECRRRGKLDIVLGMTAIYAVAEFILFQPNEYDNNKLFYLWYLFAVMLAADYGSVLMCRLEGLRGRVILCALFMAGSLLSGGLSLAREAVSSYQLFSAGAVEAGEWIEFAPWQAARLSAAVICMCSSTDLTTGNSGRTASGFMRIPPALRIFLKSTGLTIFTKVTMNGLR